MSDVTGPFSFSYSLYQSAIVDITDTGSLRTLFHVLFFPPLLLLRVYVLVERDQSRARHMPSSLLLGTRALLFCAIKGGMKIKKERHARTRARRAERGGDKEGWSFIWFHSAHTHIQYIYIYISFSFSYSSPILRSPLFLSQSFFRPDSTNDTPVRSKARTFLCWKWNHFFFSFFLEKKGKK